MSAWVDYVPRDGRERLLSSVMFAERDQRRVLQIAQDKKMLPSRGVYYILTMDPSVWLLPCTYPHPLFPPFFPFRLPFTSLPPEVPPPPENVTAAVLSYSVSHLHKGTEKLRKTCADTVGDLTDFVPSQPVFEKMTSRSSVFMCRVRTGEVRIIFSSTHVSVSEQHRIETPWRLIVSKHHDDGQYSPLEAVLSKFSPISRVWFPVSLSSEKTVTSSLL